jgi:uncharacterized membrane protein
MFGFFLISLFTFFKVEAGIHLMLIWNAILAFIPVIMVHAYERAGGKSIIKILIFFLWLIFFPNSFYLVTDLIYLNSKDYMLSLGIYQGLEYLQNLNGYLAYFHLVLAALLGIAFASFSFEYFHRKITSEMPKLSTAFFFLVPLLSSIAIYIGRFLRFNSWDIFNVFGLIKEFVSSLSWFSLVFILIFYILQILIYTYGLLKEKG